MGSILRLSLLTKPFIKNDMHILTQRLSCLQLSSSTRSFHSTTPNSEKLTFREQQLNAFDVEKKLGLRSRCVWSAEEDKLLLKLHNEYGPRWTTISTQFVNRPPAHCSNRYQLLTNRYERGPWSKEEIAKLKEACRNLPPTSDEIDWDQVQAALPVQRPMYLIKQKYAGACDPTIKQGRWSNDESNKLQMLVSRYGDNNMDRISQLMGNRTRRQCMERWRWQMADMKKGRYTKEEDAAIVNAVATYGENFAVVAKVIQSTRTPRHISQHYRNLLAPNVDRSPWTREEELRFYQAYLDEGHNVAKAKEKLQSARSFRDLWNHVLKVKRYVAKGDPAYYQAIEGEAAAAAKKQIDRAESA
ncbi:hypothetical protein K501DRAFT_284466 [Backusella circina FSU 941]|nr:hypothetical protein K501DRAFT_284466 [Backusella circina FSU 941]